MSLLTDTQTESYSYAPDSHRLQGITGTTVNSFAYDANGNTTETPKRFSPPTTPQRGVSMDKGSFMPEVPAPLGSSDLGVTARGNIVSRSRVVADWDLVHPLA